ncbi:MAG: Nif11-like leader peptide family RiPP precursor, partial [Cyanobium sp.]
MSLPSLAAFLEAASADPALQAQLLTAPDAASLAAIAQAAGFAVAEADWLAASEASRPEIAAAPWKALAADPWAEDPAPGPGGDPASPESPADPLEAFLHQAQGDAALQEALAEAPDAGAVAALAQQAGYPLSSAHLWAASEAVPDELQGAPAEEDAALQGFLQQLEGDAALQQALAEAADAAAVAQLAQAAGHPLREVDLWLASGLEPQHLAAPPQIPQPPAEAALLAFLRSVYADALVSEALAEA